MFTPSSQDERQINNDDGLDPAQGIRGEKYIFVGKVLEAFVLCEATYDPDPELEALAGQLTSISRVPQVHL
jgi:hypothetical protein